MNTRGRGRPRNSFQHAEDRELLERMYRHWKPGTPVLALAERVVGTLDLNEIKRTQAIDRLRKKFPALLKEKEKLEKEEKEKTSRSTRPEPQSRNIPLVENAKQAQQAVKILGPSGVKALKEQDGWRRENRNSIRETAKLMRRILKPKI
jgi:hypothetical protein